MYCRIIRKPNHQVELDKWSKEVPKRRYIRCRSWKMVRKRIYCDWIGKCSSCVVKKNRAGGVLEQITFEKSLVKGWKYSLAR